MSEKKKAEAPKIKSSIRIERVDSGLEYKLIEVNDQGDKTLHESTKPIILAMARQWLWANAEEA